MFDASDAGMTRRAILARYRKARGAYDPVRLAKLLKFRQRGDVTAHKALAVDPFQSESHGFDLLSKRDDTHDDMDGDVAMSSADSLTPSLPEVPAVSGSAASPFSNTNGGHDTVNRDYTTATSNMNPSVAQGVSVPQASNQNGNNSQALTSSGHDIAAASPVMPAVGMNMPTPRASLASILTGALLGVTFVLGLTLLAWKCRGQYRFGKSKRRARSTSQKLASLEEVRGMQDSVHSSGFKTRPLRHQQSLDHPKIGPSVANGPSRNSAFVAYESEEQPYVASMQQEVPGSSTTMKGCQPDRSYLEHARMSVLDMSLGTVPPAAQTTARTSLAHSEISRWSTMQSHRQLDGLALICESPRHGNSQPKLSRFETPTARPMTSPGRLSDSKSSDSSLFYTYSQTSSTKKLLTPSPVQSRKHANALSPTRTRGKLSESRGLEITRQGNSLLIRDRSISSSLRRPLSSAGTNLASALGMRPKTSVDSSAKSSDEIANLASNVICIDTTDLIARDARDDDMSAPKRAVDDPAQASLSHFHMPSSFARRVARKYPSLPDLHVLDEGSVDIEINQLDTQEPYQYLRERMSHRAHLQSCLSANSTTDSKFSAASDAPSPCASFTFEIKEVQKNAVGSNIPPEDLPRNVSLDLLPKAHSGNLARHAGEEGALHGPSRLRHCVNLTRNATLTHVNSSPRSLPEEVSSNLQEIFEHMHDDQVQSLSSSGCVNDSVNFARNMDWDIGSCASSGHHDPSRL